eukprot:gnl/TRDRNA2_/TRDRNA2_185181_c0_seq1.p1 gnl/TRDRNA2_/TRDRNA2_185181_c0~~gnl/TRDRNA2_/TRDRNA2_185181_c0_seq1.p1  ORF type:complete len:115 (+),score=16.74 gnl/TRDRNA2_/TRDRNA2_185181_c0_seq1:73-417(+)
MSRVIAVLLVVASVDARAFRSPDENAKTLKDQVTGSPVFRQKVEAMCRGAGEECNQRVTNKLFCQLLERSRPDHDALVDCPASNPYEVFGVGGPLTHLHEDEAPVETDKLKSFH